MKQIQKYRSYLSIYLIIILLTIIGVCATNFSNYGFNWIITTLYFLIIGISIRIYTISTSFYKYIKEINQQQEKETQEEITINDIINQKQTEKESEKEQQAEELDKLIDQLSEENNPQKLAEKLLSRLGSELHIVQGILFQLNKESKKFEVLSTYAYYGEEPPLPFEIGEGLAGQAARDKKRILLKELPEEYTEIISGLGKKKPKFLLLAPIVFKEETIALAELSFFEELSEQKIDKFENILKKLAEHFT